MTGSAFLALGVFIFIMFIYLVIINVQSRKRDFTDRINKRFEGDPIDEDEDTNPIEEKNKGFMNKLEQDLIDAQINMDVRVFLVLVLILSVLLYIGAFYLFQQPLVSIAPLPFTLYFLPKMIIDYRKEKQMEKFDTELVQILRRMSSVLKTGSVLQALEDVKDLPTLSEKSRIMLNEIYHRYKFGDSIEEAFYKVAEKSGSEQFQLCAISIDINKQLGADIGESLNQIAIDIQRNMLTKKESKSLTAQSVMIGRILSIVPFFLVSFMIAQDREMYIEYLSKLNHQFIFMFLIGMMFVGIYIIESVSKRT